MKTITIEVTAEDIRHGAKGDCERCPVAKALTRALGTPCRVGLWTMGPTDFSYKIGLPLEVMRFVRDFDCRYLPDPFTFTIEVPE